MRAYKKAESVRDLTLDLTQNLLALALMQEQKRAPFIFIASARRKGLVRYNKHMFIDPKPK
jgi:hypothetical protein